MPCVCLSLRNALERVKVRETAIEGSERVQTTAADCYSFVSGPAERTSEAAIGLRVV